MSKIHKLLKMFGFSLVELMAAVAVMGILVSLALPRFRAFIARSRMAEAKANLGIIATLEQSYLVEYQIYTNLSPSVGGGGNCGDPYEKNELGFRMVNCADARYYYSATASGGGSFRAEANNNGNEIYPNCSDNPQDRWFINEKRFLEHNLSALTVCYN